MLNTRFNARRGYRWVARLSICFLLIATAVLPGCKSWGKFWAIYTPGEAKPLYSGAALWNDYIAADGTAMTVRGVSANAPSGVSTRLNASGTACNATATGGYGVCIHAGLMRQAVINDKEDCSGISAKDSLGVFLWVCDVSTKPVRLISVGFNEGKYMTDLIDFDATAFKANSLTVTVAGVDYTSPATVWWANPVSNFSATTYGSVSSVVLVQSNPNSASVITNNADKTALLVRPGIKITTTSSSAALNNAGKNFSWFEGVVDLNAVTGSVIGFALSSGRFVVVQNFAVVNSSTTANTGFQVNGDNSYYRDVRYANATVSSMKSFDLLAGNAGNLLHGVIAANDEFSAQIKSTNSVILNMTSANSGSGPNVNIDFQTGNGNNVMFNTTAANGYIQGSIGPVRVSTGANTTLMNIGVANATDRGVVIAGATGTQVINVVSHRDQAGGVDMLASASTFSYFSGVAKTTNNTACTGGTPDAGLPNGGAIACTLVNNSDFTLASTSVNPAAAFVGKVTSDDSANTLDTSGVGAYALGLDWVNFSNRLRAYGNDGGTFPIAANQGRCLTGSCRIWDWSLRATDTQYRDVLAIPTGNAVAAHKWSAATQINCTQPGAVWLGTGTCNYPPFPGNVTSCAAWTGGTTATAACLSTFLRNAYEIIGDGIGNENGLCESNEACIYTPNVASYQGHGGLKCIRGPVEYGCASTFVDGTITGVVLYQYENNGY
ncbi:MAG: hypothetical protein KF713_20260 [Turneriella sp.]|nr:hypothetical protein [Turneriella sp.]